MYIYQIDYTHMTYDFLEISLSFREGNWLVHQNSGGIHRMDDLSYAGLGEHTAAAWMVGMSAARPKGSFLALPEFLTTPPQCFLLCLTLSICQNHHAPLFLRLAT